MTTVGIPVPIIRAHEDGERRWFYGGGVHTWKATAEETGGAFLLFEDLVEGGKTTPLHTHPSDESMYVLEGEILMHMDGQEHRVSAGGVTVAPRGVPHAFLVVSQTARLLCLHTPGICQAFYLGASERIDSNAEASGPVDFDLVHASASQNGGIEILGPPPFARD